MIFNNANLAFAQSPDDSEEKSQAQSGATENQDVLFRSLDYPELQVVPRASERLLWEARVENNIGPFVHWTIQVPALTTLIVGAMSVGSYRENIDTPTAWEERQSNLAAMTAMGVGAGWLIGTAYLAYLSRPYQTGLAEIKKIKGTDRRNTLMRERMAEEVLESQAQLVSTLKTMSVTSNLLSSIWVATQSDEDVATYAIVSAGLSLLPLFFPHRQVQAFEKHQEYKRKIYSPISHMDFKLSPHSNKLEPYWNLSWAF